MKKLLYTLLAAALALVTACGPNTDTTAGRHHRTHSPRPTSTVTTVPPSPTTPASPPAPGHLLVLHDPGHVTYTTHPSGCHARGTTVDDVLPDSGCTPGGIDPAVTQDNIQSTICMPGYTKGVRPPLSETAPAKRGQYTAYGIPARTVTELDHLVSLELGGDNDIENLWPELGASPNPKDSIENDLHAAVCSGKVKLADAQLAIATDWTTAEHRLGLK